MSIPQTEGFYFILVQYVWTHESAAAPEHDKQIQPAHHGHDAQPGVGRKAGVSLFMCFIDLQKVYDTVDRTLLWQVLTHIGVPPQMIAVIQQFHDRMRACVRPNDGVSSDWFEVEQGLRHGCVLSPLLFKIFFAAVLTVVIQRFSEDTVILAELVHLK